MFDGGFSDLQAHWQSCAFMIHPISTGKALSYDIIEISLWYFSNLFQNSPSSAFSMVPWYVKAINIPWLIITFRPRTSTRVYWPWVKWFGPLPTSKSTFRSSAESAQQNPGKPWGFFSFQLAFISGSKRSMFSVETGAMNWFTLWLFNIAMENHHF